MAEDDEQRSPSPFSFKKNYLLCELPHFLLSTSPPDTAAGASQPNLGCFARGWAVGLCPAAQPSAAGAGYECTELLLAGL